jgi:hypothetical protein
MIMISSSISIKSSGAGSPVSPYRFFDIFWRCSKSSSNTDCSSIDFFFYNCICWRNNTVDRTVTNNRLLALIPKAFQEAIKVCLS